MATLLSNCQEAARLLKLDVPTSIVANTTDETAQLLWALANRGGRALAKRIAWEALCVSATLTTLAALDQGALPAAFDRMVPGTMWNTTLRRMVFGPLDGQEWAEAQATTSALINPAFRIRAGHIWFSAIPTAGQSVTYEYVSKYWVNSLTASSYAADTDTTAFDDELLVLDLMWRYRQNKGLSFDDDRIEFERRLADCISNDGARRTLGPNTALNGPTKLQVPDTLTALIGL